MSKINLIISLWLSFSYLFAQSTSHTLQYDGLTREYSLYLPANYDSTQASALVFNFHGYGSNNTQQEFYGDFRPIADTANFIIVHPNGTLDPTNTRFWNVGFFNSNVDDVGFVLALIDEISSQYNIDSRKIYATGMSNGGYMSYRLACETDRFAAIASVTGSMTTYIKNNCNPAYFTPIMQIHGDADPTVNYNGDSSINSLPIDSVIQFWINTNQLVNSPQITAFPNINTMDGANAEKMVYTAPNEEVKVVLIKVYGGGHTWPGAAVNIGVTCQDFSASEEIWQFFNQYEKPIKLAVKEELAVEPSLRLYPNPANTFIYIESSENFDYLELFNLQGQRIATQSFAEQIDISQLPKGSYFIRLHGKTEPQSLKFIKF